MENQEKIYEHSSDSELAKQFKQASERIESKEFPSTDKVWSRVEEKLDKKVLTKQNNLWKKIAIAASVALVFTLAYQVFKPESQNVIPNEVVVANDSILTPPTISSENAVVNTPIENPIIKKESEQILQQQLTKPAAVAMEEHAKTDATDSDDSQEPETDMVFKSKKASPTARPGRFQKGKAFDAVGVSRREVHSEGSESDKKAAPEAAIVGNSEAPLVILDGKAITGKEALKINTVTEGIAKVDPKDEKEVVVLKEPLYIINGRYFTEEELFGPNPTSPYAPLNQQEIESISVLQGEKAISNYGKRGEKGVVIIKTKDGKPAQNGAKTSTEKPK